MLRRAILLITGTATAVTGALVYNPPQLASVATDSLPVTPTPTASKSPPAGTKNPSTKTPTAVPTPVAPPQNNLPSGVFAGNTINTRWGPVQVEITVKDGVVTAAKALRFPSGDQRSLSISQQAIPYLVQQTLGVVSASGVQGVSRASYTSDGWRSSLQSALKKAGI
ncbi:MAG: FMN-binding protein [Actinobacteria bacterium]|nr:FMN-binding protein [Actinomycetota bacterium]